MTEINLSLTVEEVNGILPSLASALSLTETQLDELFTLAASL